MFNSFSGIEQDTTSSCADLEEIRIGVNLSGEIIRPSSAFIQLRQGRPLDNINKALAFDMFSDTLTLVPFLLSLEKHTAVMPIDFGEIQLFVDLSVTPEVDHTFSLCFERLPFGGMVSAANLMLTSEQEHFESLIQALPFETDFRTPSNDTHVVDYARKLLGLVLETSRDFLIENIHDSAMVEYWVNFYVKPTHPALKMMLQSCTRLENPFRAYINLILLRLFFPPLFGLPNCTPSVAAQLKDVMRDVYHLIAGFSLKKSIKENDYETTFVVLYQHIPRTDREYGFKKYLDCFVASEIIDWMMKTKVFGCREDALRLCIELNERKYIEHMFDDRKFQDEHFFYRWTKTSSGAPACPRDKCIVTNPRAVKEIFTKNRPLSEFVPLKPKKEKKMSVSTENIPLRSSAQNLRGSNSVHESYSARSSESIDDRN